MPPQESTQSADEFRDVYDLVLQTTPPPLLLPAKNPFNPPLTAQISALQVHPTLEAALHILNHDLPSAHFLVRHMQAPPAVEGMYLHAVLHRIEGDFDNARAWYRNIEEDERNGFELVRTVEHSMQKLQTTWTWASFVDQVQTLAESRRRGPGHPAVEGDDQWTNQKLLLSERSLAEIRAVIEHCRRKFRDGRWEDASSAWVRPSEAIRVVGEKMVSGGEGWRKF